MKGQRKIERYIDAVRGLTTIEQAMLDEPKVDRKSAYLLARAEFKAARGALTGGELGAAQRILAMTAASALLDAQPVPTEGRMIGSEPCETSSSESLPA